jgi:hypothetical protein
MTLLDGKQLESTDAMATMCSLKSPAAQSLSTQTQSIGGNQVRWATAADGGYTCVRVESTDATEAVSWRVSEPNIGGTWSFSGGLVGVGAVVGVPPQRRVPSRMGQLLPEGLVWFC